MKCRNCHHEVRPVVAIDIDGTLGEYHDHFIKFARGYFDRYLPANYDGSVELHEWLGLSLADYREAKLAYRQGGLKRTMPLKAYATDLIHHMQAMRTSGIVELFITTTRPYLRLDQTDPDTRFWLDKNKIPYDGLLYHDDKYQRLGEIVDPETVVAVLDDLPQQYDSAAQMFGSNVPIMAAGSNNKAVRRPNVAPDLRRAVTMIQERVGAWHLTQSQKHTA